jgi:hypothetical protein
LDSAIASISSCWYRNSSRSSTRRYSYCLRSGSVISTSAVPLVNVRYVVSTAEGLLKLNSNTAGSFGSRSRRVWLQLEPHHYCSSSRSRSRGNSKVSLILQ